MPNNSNYFLIIKNIFRTINFNEQLGLLTIHNYYNNAAMKSGIRVDLLDISNK